MADPATFGQRFNQTLEQTLGSSRLVGANATEAQQRQQIKELAYKAYIVSQESVYNGQKGIIVEAWLPETLANDINASYEAPFAQGLNQAAPDLGAFARFLGVNLTTQALTAQVWQGGGFIEFSIPFVLQAETSAAADVMEPILKLYSLTMPKDPSGGGLLRAPGPRIDINKLAARTGDAAADLGRQLASTASDVASGLGKVASNLLGTKSFTDATAGVVNNDTGFTSQVLDRADNAAKTVSTALVNSVVNNISLHLGQFMYFPSVVITDVNPTFDVVLAEDKNPTRATVNVNFRTFYVPTDQDLKTMFPATASLSKKAR